MEFRVLGPVEARLGGHPVNLGSRKQRFVLAVLLLDVNRLVPVDRLVELVWDGRPPPTARTVIQTHVYRLRTVLTRIDASRSGVRLTTAGGGYLLAADPMMVDVHRFRALTAQAREDENDARRAALLTEALDLWRGPALAGVAPAAVRDRLCRGIEEARAVAVEDRVDAELRLGHHHDVVCELVGLVQAHPLRERLVGQLMLALYRCGRCGDALDLCRETRRRLVEELGLDPGARLVQLETAIRRNDPSLDPPAGPGVRTGGTRPVAAQLPAPAMGFTGRTNELARLDALLPAERAPAGAAAVVTAIAGTAGVGKTALALHWAHRVRDRFADGQLYVNLRGYSPGPPLRPIQALAGMLRAFNVAPENIPTDEDAAAGLYRSLLADRRVLVVLDNARNPAQVRPLLPVSPGCLALVTSRDRLTGLAANDGAHRIALDVLTPEEARTLLTRLLGAGRVAAEPAAVADLARACAYLPLALRIAAANLANHSGRGIAGYLRDLRGGDGLAALESDGDDRSAVRAAFDLSYRQLDAPARRLFRRLGLVPGPDATAAAAATLIDTTASAARRVLDRLAAGHLITEPAAGRYACHDLLRLYAMERAESEEPATDRAAARQRLLDWYLYTVDNAARLLYPEILRLALPPPAPGTRQVHFDDCGEALAWIEAERTNVAAAVRDAARHGPRPSAWRLADAMRGYFGLRMHFVEWLTVARGGLVAAEAEEDVPAQASAHLCLATCCLWLGRLDAATVHYQRVAKLARQCGWPQCQAAALGNLGIVYQRSGRPRDAIDAYTRSLALDRDTGRLIGQAINLGNIGTVHRDLGQLRQAASYHAEALALYRQLGSGIGQANTLMNLGELAQYLGRFDHALGQLAEALTISRDIGDRVCEAGTLRVIAAVHRDAGRQDEALRYGRSALMLARDTGEPRGEAEALNTLGTICHEHGDHDDAIAHHLLASEPARRTGDSYTETEALLGLAAAHQHQGDTEQALAAAREARTTARQHGYRLLEGQALARLAAVALTLGRPGDAIDDARRALAIQVAIGHRRGAAATRRLLARALPADREESASRPA